MKARNLAFALSVLLFASMACSLFGGGSSGVGGSAPGSDGSTSGNSVKYDTEFPMPPKVENFTNMGNGIINYQTSIAMADMIDFYRDSFADAGYEEREITTSIRDTAFSIVWIGHPGGKLIVVQGVDMGNGTLNVNVRLEED